ncbi:MATE efflux family protein [Clostridium bornimense]|uniref:Probable multidrug resistance protein NorM n=1 Tax=Clostridium bornimense TaxID=1216932 RepID=W6RZ72_9CLOT|nr:MATE family efflux transporter [Clostridium bornimense]CDM69926.1 MATE efflux family protein [Clostridium bornimense]
MGFYKNNKKDITIIFSLAIPVIVENILQTLLGTTDTYFAGHINDNSIAAIGVTNLIVNIFIAFFSAVSIGTGTIVSRNFGREDYEKVNNAIKQSSIIGIVLGLIIGVISIAFYKPILMISGLSIDLIGYTLPYYMIVTVPLIFLCLSIILSSCLRAIKDTKTPMIAVGVSNIINIIFNAIFINLGLGILGLGLATTTSRIVNVIILLVKLMKGNEVKLNYKNMIIDKKMIISILKIGIPAGIEKLVMRIGQLVYNSMIISIGISAYVAHNIAGNIEGYTYIPAMAFGIATATLVGISIGESNIKKAKNIVYLSDVMATIFMIIIAIIFFFFAPQFANLFTETKEIQGMVVSVLRLIALFQPFAALTQIITGALQGAGDTKFPMYSTLIGIWIGRVGVGYLLGVVFKLGLLGVWMGYAFDIILRGLILLKRFLDGKWQKIDI